MPASSPLSASFIAESVVSFGKVIVVIFLNISVGKDTHIYSNCKTIIPFFLFWGIISQENLLYSRKRRIFAIMFEKEIKEYERVREVYQKKVAEKMNQSDCQDYIMSLKQIREEGTDEYLVAFSTCRSTTHRRMTTIVTGWRTVLGASESGIANYEGMCLGPKLPDGRQVIILCADSQGRYMGVLHDWFRTIVL